MQDNNFYNCHKEQITLLNSQLSLKLQNIIIFKKKTISEIRNAQKYCKHQKNSLK